MTCPSLDACSYVQRFGRSWSMNAFPHQQRGSSAASVVRYGQLAVADVAAVASAAEAIDEVT
jgi:hypothetical protein